MQRRCLRFFEKKSSDFFQSRRASGPNRRRRLTHELVKPVQRLACYFNRFGVVTVIHLTQKEPSLKLSGQARMISNPESFRDSFGAIELCTIAFRTLER
jgi:hypothetical protein